MWVWGHERVSLETELLGFLLLCEESFLGEDLILLRLPPKGKSCGGKSFPLIPYTHKSGISSIRAIELDACRCLSHKRCLCTVSVTVPGQPLHAGTSCYLSLC